MDPTIKTRPAPETSPPPRRQARPDQAPPTLAGDRLNLSTPRKLLEGNKKALGVAGRILWHLVSKPGEALSAMGRGLWGMVRHPGQAFARVAERFRQDPVDGAIQGLLTGSTLLGLGALAVLPVAFLAAPFTGGASLAVMPLLGTVGTVASTVALGSTVASLAKNEYDVATADTRAQMEEQSRELGSDFANIGLTAGGYGLGKALGAAWRRLSRRKGAVPQMQHDSFATTNKIKDKLGLGPRDVPEGGLSTEGMSRAQFRAKASGLVDEALGRTPQGRRPTRMTELDTTGFEGLENVGERRMAFHGTSGDARPAIRAEGLARGDTGVYGEGIYVGSSADVGVLYADDAAMRLNTSLERPGVFAVEIAPGRVMDYRAMRDEFVRWAKANFDPQDMADPLNRVYAKTPTQGSVWNRYLQRFAQEKGYDSILVKGIEGKSHDYWVLHDPARVKLRQEFAFDAPPNTSLMPGGLNGVVATTAGRNLARDGAE